MQAVKAFNSKLQATMGKGIVQFEPGGTYEEPECNCAKNGYHCTEDPLDVLNYYRSMDTRFFIVKAEGEIHQDGHGSRISCTKLTLVKEISRIQLAAMACLYMEKYPDRKTDSRYVEKESGKCQTKGDFIIVRGEAPEGSRRGRIHGVSGAGGKRFHRDHRDLSHRDQREGIQERYLVWSERRQDMRKETLRSLKRINATPKMVQMAKNNNKWMVYKNIYGWSDRKRDTEFDVLVRTQTRGAYLMVCIFYPERIAAGELTPTYEIYCNPEGNEYITRYLKNGEEKGWLTGMVDNLELNYHIGIVGYEVRSYPGIEKRVWQNPEGKKTIQRFLGTKGTGLAGLKEWQQKAKDKKTEEKEAREHATWDADMELIPPVMPSFSRWMQREAAGEYFIIYERKGKEPDVGWCSGCQRFVPVQKPRHNKKGRCVCGREITYKAAGRIKTLSVSWYSGECIQEIKGGIVVREFEQYQYYRDTDYTKPYVIQRENTRIMIMDDGTVKRYWYGNYKNKKQRFIRDKDYIPIYGTYYSSLTNKLYRRNLKKLKKTALKNSTVDMWETLPVSVTRYLAIERENPAIEKLVRIGMFRLAEDLMRRNGEKDLLSKEESELAKILKIDNARLKRLRAIDGGIEHLKWYQLEKQRNTIWPDGMIKDLGDEKLQEKTFNFLPQNLSNVKIWNYLRRQGEMAEGRALHLIRDTWRDYLNMAEKAKMDVKNERIWKPKDLQAAHNEVVLLLQKGEMEKEAEKLEKKWPKVNGNLPKLKKFEYADKDFAVLAPENILDIVKEGRILQHCVHTCDFYFDRIQRDETYLFFLRRADHKDIPWYTLEVEAGGNIRQKRTTGDNQNKDFDEAVAFLKKWQKIFVKRLTKEEKETGKKADQARIQEYKKLRENGNRVWRGKLAGQLLADVLEADFMAAAT